MRMRFLVACLNERLWQGSQWDLIVRQSLGLGGATAAVVIGASQTSADVI